MKDEVREAGLGDVVRVVEIELGSETAPHWGEGEYRRIVEGGSGVARCLLVGELDGVVGFAVGKVVAGVGELESVAVDAAMQRRGVGRALCAAVVAWCRGAGALVVELEVRAGSTGAREMYEGLGFREVGRRVRYYAGPVEDAVLMRLELGGDGAEFVR